jgi:hypothetical protein
MTSYCCWLSMTIYKYRIYATAAGYLWQYINTEYKLQIRTITKKTYLAKYSLSVIHTPYWDNYTRWRAYRSFSHYPDHACSVNSFLNIAVVHRLRRSNDSNFPYFRNRFYTTSKMNSKNNRLHWNKIIVARSWPTACLYTTCWSRFVRVYNTGNPE